MWHARQSDVEAAGEEETNVAKTAFVTGASGFIGLNLVEHLCSLGWQVSALHRPSSDVRLLRDWGVRCVEGDITDYRRLKGCIPEGVDAVFHVAGNTRLWTRIRAEQMRVNVRGTRNVVRAALAARAQRLVHLSSIVAYGLHGGIISEETPTRGSGSPIYYVRSKALAEREVRRGIGAGLPAVIVNPSNTLGRYDLHNWARLFRLVRQHRIPAMPPGGGSFCHADEVVRAMVAAAERGRVGQNYLLGGAPTTYVGLVRAMADQMGVRRRVWALPPALLQRYAGLEEMVATVFRREPDITREAVALLSQNFYCHSRLAETELGYRSRPLSEMLSDCHDWLLAQGQAG